MAVTLKVNIQGLKELDRKFSDPKVVAVPMRRFLLRSADYVEPRIERRIRKRTGRGRASVQRLMDTAKVPRFVKIFSKLHYVRFLEFGAPGHNQKARKPFRSTLRRSRKVIFRFANDAGREIAAMLTRGGR